VILLAATMKSSILVSVQENAMSPPMQFFYEKYSFSGTVGVQFFMVLCNQARGVQYENKEYELLKKSENISS